MKEKKVVREERNKEKLTSGDWVMAEFYSIHSLKSSRMHAVIDEFKKLMGGKVEGVQVNVEEKKKTPPPPRTGCHDLGSKSPLLKKS
jgi:thioredoxin